MSANEFDKFMNTLRHINFVREQEQKREQEKKFLNRVWDSFLDWFSDMCCGRGK